MSVYALHDCAACERTTDHYLVEHGSHVELVCDVCSEIVDVVLLRDLVEVA